MKYLNYILFTLVFFLILLSGCPCEKDGPSFLFTLNSKQNAANLLVNDSSFAIINNGIDTIYATIFGSVGDPVIIPIFNTFTGGSSMITTNIEFKNISRFPDSTFEATIIQYQGALLQVVYNENIIYQLEYDELECGANGTMIRIDI